MKKVYSTIMMLAIMVAALSFSACSSSSSDDDDFGYESNSGEMTLKVDGESYYCGDGSSVEQTKNSGMYIEVCAVEEMRFQMNGHDLIMRISPSRVSQLKVGQEFSGSKISVREFRHFNEIVVNAYEWEVVSGSFTIKTITSMEMTIQLNNMVLRHKRSKVEHTIEGTAVLNSGVWGNGGLLPFDEAITDLPDWLEKD
jgi:hypothetical protein